MGLACVPSTPRLEEEEDEVGEEAWVPLVIEIEVESTIY